METEHKLYLSAEEINERLLKVPALDIFRMGIQDGDFIRVSIDHTAYDGMEIKFKSPVECQKTTKLRLEYTNAENNTIFEDYAFVDAHGASLEDLDLEDVNALFSAGTVVKVVLDRDVKDTNTYRAFVQNAVTNTYIENQFQQLRTHVDNSKAEKDHKHTEYLTAIPEEYITEAELDAKQYLTEHQSLSGYATEVYVEQKVAEMVDSAPETLNTLNELATALGNDPNFATTVAAEIGGKQEKLTPGTNIIIEGNTISATVPEVVIDQEFSSNSENAQSGKAVNEIVTAKTTYSNSEPLLSNIGGIQASEHANGFDNVPIADLITELLYPYTAPVINSFTLNPGAGVKEKNVALEVKTATAKVTKKSKSIESVSLYKGNSLVETKTDEITSAGTTLTFTINETLDGSTNTGYQIRVTENNGKTVTSDASYSFVYPYFYGVIAGGTSVDSEAILAFTKSVRAKGSHSYSYTTSNQCPVIAYPKEYGNLKSIVDPNNFTQDWTKIVVNVNNGTTIKGIDYNVYIGGASTATATYKFNY